MGFTLLGIYGIFRDGLLCGILGDPLKYLAKMPHFSFLPKDELEWIAQNATEENISKDTVYAKQGKSRIDTILIATKGSLALFDEKKSLDKPTGYIRPGDVFGGITILLNAGISLRTVVVEETFSCYAVSKEIFLVLCARYKDFHHYFLENFSANIFDDPSLSAIVETGQAKHFLSNVIPFTFLPPDEIESAATKLSLVQYPENTILFIQESSRIGYLYILHQGAAERYYEEGGKRTLRDIISEGDIYGGISMLVNDGISVRTLRVTEPSYFYLLPKQSFIDLCQRFPTFSEYFTDIFGKRMLERSYASIIAKNMQSEEEGLQFFNQPISSLRPGVPIFGDVGMSILEAAKKMRQERISALFLKDDAGHCAGVVTERDLARKAIADEIDSDKPVGEIMSWPVHNIPDQALVFEALMTMMQADIRHLAVTDTNDEVTGILSNRDLLSAQSQSPLFLLREINEADSMAEIIDQHNQLPEALRSLVTSGAKAKNLTRFITMVSDAILEIVMQFTLDKLGPPPVKFAFMIMGSEGRKEQTLKTDQDNAIVYEDVPKEDQKEVNAYFLTFGETACDLLNQAGFAFCTGDVMAKNPRWCQPLKAWKKYFSYWIREAAPEHLLEASIFFDFRTGYGEEGLIESLRQHLFGALEGWAGFFRHLTENALYFRPPIGFLGNFVVESKGEHRSKFDIKSAMQPIVDFARIYALKNNISETNTLERLNLLRLNQILQAQEYEELEKAYSFMMQLRFVRQMTAILDKSVHPDNYINPKRLTRIEQQMLKEIFKRVSKFQGKLEFEFIGRI